MYRQAWLHIIGSSVFVKTVLVCSSVVHPDWALRFELYTDANFLELETLGPTTLLPDVTCWHDEPWLVLRFSGAAARRSGGTSVLTDALRRFADHGFPSS